MPGFEFMGISIQIPFFLVALLFLAYMLWGKYYNGGSLSIKKENSVEQVFRICLLFVIFTTTIMIFTLFILSFFYLPMMNLTDQVFSDLWSKWTFAIGFFSIVILFVILGTNEESHKTIFDKRKPLFRLLSACKYITTTLFSFTLGMFVWSVRFKLPILSMSTYMLFGVAAIAMIFSFFAVDTLLDVTVKRWTLSLIIIVPFIVGFLALWLVTPHIHLAEITSDAELIDVIPTQNSWQIREAYLVSQGYFDITTLGFFATYFNIIPVQYEGINIITDSDVASKYFNIWLLSEDMKKGNDGIYYDDQILRSYKECESFNGKNGLISCKSFMNQSIIGLVFDRKDFNAHNKTRILVEGIKPARANLIKFSGSHIMNCQNDTCVVSVNLSNKEDLPVKLLSPFYFAIPECENNESNSYEFTNISWSGNVNRSWERDPDCKGNNCNFELINYDKPSRTVADIQYRLDKNIMNVIVMNIDPNITINMSIVSKC